MNRSADTNQRIFFDVDPSGKTLATGNVDGRISSWSLAASQSDSQTEETEQWTEQAGDASLRDPQKEASDQNILISFQAHEDCVNGIR